jgi:hypothetical protein
MRFLLAWFTLFGSLSAHAQAVPAGTRFEAKLETAVKTETAAIGDNVAAVLMKPLRLAGKTVMPQGTRLNGRVETLQAATRTNEGHVRLVFREVHFPDGQRVESWITNSFAATPQKRGLKYVVLMGTGAAAGAFVAGARVAGILGGLLVGFVIADNSQPSKLPDVTLKAGKQIDLELREELVLQKN